MKKSVLAFLLIFSIAFFKKAVAQDDVKVKKILDSLEVLKKLGAFVDGFSYPPTQEETRYYNITTMLLGLPYNETRKLLHDKNMIARCYGFAITAKRFRDSLTEADLYIFGDTSSLPINTQRGIIDPGVTVGQFCEMAYASSMKEKRISEKRPEIISTIKKFISDNSLYPGSYEPVDFAEFSWSGTDDMEAFEIRHKYKLKQNDGTLVEVADYFVLDKALRIVLIETIRSNTVNADPPKLEEWLRRFGKNN